MEGTIRPLVTGREVEAKSAQDHRVGCEPINGQLNSVQSFGPGLGPLPKLGSQPAPRGSCPASTAEPGTVGNLPPLCVMPVAPCLLLGSGHSQSGQDP